MLWKQNKKLTQASIQRIQKILLRWVFLTKIFINIIICSKQKKKVVERLGSQNIKYGFWMRNYVQGQIENNK